MIVGASVLCCDCMNAGGLVAELTDKDQIKKGNFIMTRRLHRGRGSNPAWLLVGAALYAAGYPILLTLHRVPTADNRCSLLMPASVGCVVFACRQAPSAAEH